MPIGLLFTGFARVVQFEGVVQDAGNSGWLCLEMCVAENSIFMRPDRACLKECIHTHYLACPPYYQTVVQTGCVIIYLQPQFQKKEKVGTV